MVLWVLCIGLSYQVVWADSVPVAKRRDSHMVIQANGEIQVEEVWVMEFPKREKPFHKGYRMIPFRRLTDIAHWEMEEEGHRYREVIKGSEEQPYTFYEEVNNEGKKYTWFFPRTEGTTRTFRIRYRLEGALRIDPLEDQLYYESIEADRAYVVQAVHVEVSFPSSLQENQLQLKSYLNGMSQGNGVMINDHTISIQAGPIASGSHWAIRVRFPHGIVHADAPLWQHREEIWKRINLGALFLTPIILFGGGLFVFLLWYRRGRDIPISAKIGMVTNPPDQTPPALVGVLLEEKVKFRHILATIFDLARRGFLKIKKGGSAEADSNGGYSEFIFTRTQNKGIKDLFSYERQVLEGLFRGKDERKLSALKYKFAEDLPWIRSSISDQVEENGDFLKSPPKVIRRYRILGVILLSLSIAMCIASCATMMSEDKAPATILVGIALMFVSALLTGMAGAMPKRTAQGNLAAAKWRAFLKYLKELKKYRNTAKAQEVVEHYLPYAIAFNFEEKLIRHFSDLNVLAPSWYSPGVVTDASSIPTSTSSGMGESSLSTGFSLPSMDSISHEFFSMLDSAASVLSSREPSSTSGSSDGGSGSGGGGGGSSGGGSSGFD